MVTGSEPEREVYHRKGDVLIICDSKEMLVSSQVLSMVSPVFERMFEPGFSEGDKKRSKDDPLRLPLDDDSSEALTLLFHILHFSPRQRYNEPSVDLILRLVQLADKYGCLDPIQDPIERWLYPLTRTEHHDRVDLVKLVAVSFLIGSRDSFRKSASVLLKQLSADEIDDLCCQNMLPQSLKGMIHDKIMVCFLYTILLQMHFRE